MRKYSSVKSFQENTTGKYWEVYYRIDVGSHISVFAQTKILQKNLKQNKKKTLQNSGVISISSPLHLGSKSFGNYQWCIDYDDLNNITKRDQYPMLNII